MPPRWVRCAARTVARSAHGRREPPEERPEPPEERPEPLAARPAPPDARLEPTDDAEPRPPEADCEREIVLIARGSARGTRVGCGRTPGFALRGAPDCDRRPAIPLRCGTGCGRAPIVVLRSPPGWD